MYARFFEKTRELTPKLAAGTTLLSGAAALGYYLPTRRPEQLEKENPGMEVIYRDKKLGKYIVVDYKLQTKGNLDEQEKQYPGAKY